MAISGDSLRKTASTSGKPAMHAVRARDHDGLGLRVLRHGRDGGDIAGAAEILGQRAGHRLVDFQRGEKGVGTKQ